MSKKFFLYLEYKNQKYPCELIPKKRNRNIRIRIAKTSEYSAEFKQAGFPLDPEGNNQLDLFLPLASPAYIVKVSYPPGLSRWQVKASLTESAAWIAAHFKKISKEQKQQANPILKTGTRIMFQGNKLTLVFLPTTRRKQKVKLAGTRLLCTMFSTQQQKLKKVLEQWYREQAARYIENRTTFLAAGITRKPYRIRIAGQKTQWGSCSAAGVLSFNWKLMMAPKYILDYIIVHELAHLEEMNHSQRFWQVVRAHSRTVDRAKLWLKKHGARLDSI